VEVGLHVLGHSHQYADGGADDDDDGEAGGESGETDAEVLEDAAVGEELDELVGDCRRRRDEDRIGRSGDHLPTDDERDQGRDAGGPGTGQQPAQPARRAFLADCRRGHRRRGDSSHGAGLPPM
jgi:hypothetical protein